MVSCAIQQDVVGNWGMSLLWLGGSLVVGILILYLWQIVVERSLSASESAGTIKSVTPRRGATEGRSAVDKPLQGVQQPPLDLLTRVLPKPVVAIMLKDFKYFRRDPQLQAVL